MGRLWNKWLVPALFAVFLFLCIRMANDIQARILGLAQGRQRPVLFACLSYLPHDWEEHSVTDVWKIENCHDKSVDSKA